MKSNIIEKKKIIILFIAVILFCIVPINVNAATKETKTDKLDANGEIKMNTDDINITVRVGYKGKFKVDKNVRIDAVIDNKGGDFTGKLRVKYSRRTADGTTVSQKIFAAASGEKKKVQLVIPNPDSDDDIGFMLCDENDKVLCEKYVPMNSNDFSRQLFIGALSDDVDALNYISNELAADKTSIGAADEGYLFELESADITNDVKMLDALDVIMIDDFDTGKLSESQITTITEWISDGGTLILGSGADADKVLKAFSGSLLNGRIGSTRSIRTNFGVSRKELTSLIGENLFNKKVPLDITRLRIQGATSVVTDGTERLISLMPYGKGNVLVSEFSFSLGSEATKLYGRFIANTIKNNLSDNRKNYIGLTTTNSWSSYSYYGGYYYEDEALLLNETDSLPNLKLYGVLLIVYVLLAGPISYIITKKKDKRNLLWCIIPVLSAAFSITIYLIGTSTRIQRPYINYVSTIELPEKASGENKINTKFSLTSASNKSYETFISSDIDILPTSAETGRYYGISVADTSKEEFDYGIEYGASDTKLMMKNLSAFESVYFMIGGKSNNTGVVEIDVAKKDGKISGIINNKMSCNLENCIFVNNGTIYYIGDFPSGKAFDISKTPKEDIHDDDTYSDDFESRLSNALGGDFYSGRTNNDIKRKYAMIMKYIRNNRVSDTWFYGFVADGEETSFTNVLEYDKYGATGVYKTAEVAEKVDGYDVIGSLEKYAYDFDGNKTDGYYVYDNKTDSFKVQYKFPENFSLKKIIYNKDTAGGNEYNLQQYGYTDNVFLGEAKVLDKDGKYVTLIKSAQDAEIDDIEKYLDDDGSLTIYYDMSYTRDGSFDFDQLTLPKVSLAGKYTRR